LKSDVKREITLQIRDEHAAQSVATQAQSTRSKTSSKRARILVRSARRLASSAGLHRFVWNLQWSHPATLPYGYYGRPSTTPNTRFLITPSPADTTLSNRRTFVVPGNYEVVLTVDGQSYRQPLVVKLDPRVQASQSDLQSQLDLARQIVDGMESSYSAYYQLHLATRARRETKSLAGMPMLTDAIAAATALIRN